MAKLPRFSVVYAPEAIEHLDGVERKYHGLIRQTIKEQLASTPTRKTRNRKPLEQPAPFDATWELRCGQQNRFRVFYEVNLDSRSVCVLAIGIKENSRLFINGEEYPS